MSWKTGEQCDKMLKAIEVGQGEIYEMVENLFSIID